MRRSGDEELEAEGSDAYLLVRMVREASGCMHEAYHKVLLRFLRGFGVSD